MNVRFVIGNDRVEVLKEQFPDGIYKPDQPGFTFVEIEIIDGLDALKLFHAGSLYGIRSTRSAVDNVIPD